jgi:preprotein translocase subunit SecG
METILENVLIVISIIIIALVLLQSNKAESGAQIITGGNADLFQNIKERGIDLVISRLTMIAGLIFFGVSLVLFLFFA